MLGVTPPISLDPPKEADVKASEGESHLDEVTLTPALMADLVALNQFESEQERKVR